MKLFASTGDLKSDAEEAGIPAEPAPMRTIQSDEPRKGDAKSRSYFNRGYSRHMSGSRQTCRPRQDHVKRPPDLELFDLCEKAEQAVMFLCSVRFGFRGNIHCEIHVGVSEEARIACAGRYQRPGGSKSLWISLIPMRRRCHRTGCHSDGFAAWEKNLQIRQRDRSRQDSGH